MPGTTYRVIPKQVLNASAGGPISIAKGVDISAYREATLIVRVHAGTAITAGTLTIDIFADAPTTEDGQEFFVALSGITTTFTTGATAGTLVVLPIGSSNLPSFLRVNITWASASGQAVISADIVAKS